MVSSYKNSAGNVLFLILIAVALFAALSYAVTSSSRSSGGSVSREKMNAAFSEIQNVVTAHRTAFQRMVMSGIDPMNISAYDCPNGWGVVEGEYCYPNPNCTSNACLLYHPQGGGLTRYNFKKLHPELSTTLTGDVVLTGAMSRSFWDPVSAGGTTKHDYVYTIAVTRAFCDFINEKLNVGSVDSHTGYGSSSLVLAMPTHPLDAYDRGDAANGLGSTVFARHLIGSDMGCIYEDTAGTADAATASYMFFATIYVQ